MKMCLINFPEEILEKIFCNLRTKELIPLLQIKVLNQIVKKRLFSVLRIENDNQIMPPRSTWEHIRRLECFNMPFSKIDSQLKYFPNLQQLVLDDCSADCNFELPAVKTLVLGNTSSSHLKLPLNSYNMLAITLTNSNKETFKHLKANMLHITIQCFESFIEILPHLNCKELYVYGDECEMPKRSQNWKLTQKFEKLSLCGMLPLNFVHNLLQHTKSNTLNLELVEMSSDWKDVLASHPRLNVLVQEDSDSCIEKWNLPMNILQVNGTLCADIAYLCGYANYIVFDKCLSGKLKTNLKLLQQNYKKCLKGVTLINYKVKQEILQKMKLPVNVNLI
eukprot:NODE_19_length_47148_cov_1.447810.p14 type:complete len:335 gc:universal NODE_19_length_47148_cov_1.447810:45379-46383(+)